MKIARFMSKGRTSYGVVVDNDWIVEPTGDFLFRYPDIKTLLSQDGLALLFRDVSDQNTRFKIKDVQLLPPLAPDNKIICVGINFRKKYPLERVAPSDPENIIVFSKQHDALVGQGETLELPQGKAADSFDYEGEITLVIGKGGRNITREKALSHVAGFTIINDGSVRGWQKHSLHAGKNFARSGGCGPWIVSADEVENLNSMSLTTRINGEVRQQTTVDQMIFSVDALIAYISHFTPLNPGDLIATGTPEGAGGSFSPARFLKSGDVVEITVSNVGTLSNQVSR